MYPQDLITREWVEEYCEFYYEKDKLMSIYDTIINHFDSSKERLLFLNYLSWIEFLKMGVRDMIDVKNPENLAEFNQFSRFILNLDDEKASPNLIKHFIAQISG